MVITLETIRYWKEVGRRIREIRTLKGKATKDIAVDSEILKSAISHFERGISPTSLNYALFLRNEYGISFDWIYDGETILKAHRSKKAGEDVLDPISIGVRLKELREGLGVNRVEFGKITGITNGAICNFEKGLRTPRIESALKIKQATQKPLDWIYFGDEIIIPKSVKRAKRLSKSG